MHCGRSIFSNIFIILVLLGVSFSAFSDENCEKEFRDYSEFEDFLEEEEALDRLLISEEEIDPLPEEERDPLLLWLKVENEVQLSYRFIGFIRHSLQALSDQVHKNGGIYGVSEIHDVTLYEMLNVSFQDAIPSAKEKEETLHSIWIETDSLQKSVKTMIQNLKTLKRNWTSHQFSSTKDLLKGAIELSRELDVLMMDPPWHRSYLAKEARDSISRAQSLCQSLWQLVRELKRHVTAEIKRGNSDETPTTIVPALP